MEHIDFKYTGISPLLRDYLAQMETLQPFYTRFSNEENYVLQAKKKLQEFTNRKTLYNAINQQHADLELHDKQIQNLVLLEKNNTVTVTTGHQLNLLTGPLYFIYKILHTVKICDKLNQKQNEINFVPIYWMATEDHDFEEINHFNTYDSHISYQATNGGFVGEINSKETEIALKNFIATLGENKFENELKTIIEKAYFQAYDLAKATRILVHELLGKFGILILDANDSELKKFMIPYFEKELFNSKTQQLVQQTNEQLAAYKNQAYARDINLFYLNNNKRERIEKRDNQFVLVDSLRQFSENEIKQELFQKPEKFSPNVMLRPLYQEVILPNVAYVGGGGELAYWLQLKAVFEEFDVVFPMLVLRNSMLLIPNAIKHKAEKFNLLSKEIFQPKFVIENKFTEQHSELLQALENLKVELKQKFEQAKLIANKTSPTFKTMLNAQEKKQLNGFDKMHQRLLKSEKQRFNSDMQKIDEVYNYFFPKENWQERVINFSEFYVQLGDEMFQVIYDEMPAFESKFLLTNLTV